MKNEGFESQMVLQVHDNLLIDTVEKEITQVRDLITECMLKKPWKFAQIVPMECEWKRGLNWYDMEDI